MSETPAARGERTVGTTSSLGNLAGCFRGPGTERNRAKADDIMHGHLYTLWKVFLCHVDK